MKHILEAQFWMVSLVPTQAGKDTIARGTLGDEGRVFFKPLDTYDHRPV